MIPAKIMLEPLVTYHGCQGPLLLIIADGVGVAPPGPANAVALANTPNLKQYQTTALYTELKAHGTAVGMPSDADMGNSEVGHNTIGCGRIFAQGAKLVDSAINSESIFNGEVWQSVVQAGLDGHTVHFLGLLSDGNVHSHINHLIALLERCKTMGVHRVRLHILLDGRDVAARSALEYIAKIEQHLSPADSMPDFDYKIASGGGRMTITMDRYQADWSMVKRGYDAHVHGIAKKTHDASVEIKVQYSNDAALTDQLIQPFVIVDKDDKPIGKIEDGDAVLLFNFRGDRAIEISQALENPSFNQFDRGIPPKIYFCAILQYDADLNLPTNYLVNPPVVKHTMSEYLCAEKIRSFALSETQKFGHVTYFWNGNRSGYINEKLETYIKIPSDNIPFWQKPAMKAPEITAKTIELLESGKYRFGRINFANGDMVGHTGDLDATVLAIETIDQCVGRLVDCVNRLNGAVIITSDHGNADKMFCCKGGQKQRLTSHTLNPVPFYIIDNQRSNKYTLSNNDYPALANIAATIFNLLGYRAPADYFPSLIHLDKEPRDRKTLYAGGIVNLGLETARSPNNELVALEIVRHPGSVAIIAANDQLHVCLIKQFRHAIDRWIWECPAGTLEHYEPIEQTAHRELLEEAGCTAKKWTPLGTIVSTPGFCNERLNLYLAQDLALDQPQHEQHELIEIHWIALEQALTMVQEGQIEDAKTIVALFKAAHVLGFSSPGKQPNKTK